VKYLRSFAIILLLAGCGSTVEKKILQETDYRSWQRDLELRARAEKGNLELIRQLMDIALINEDFPRVLESIQILRQNNYGDEKKLALTEIAVLRYSWRLDDCLAKIDAYAQKYPKDEATPALLSERSLIAKSKALPPPLAVSPYATSKDRPYSFVQLMQAPELMLRRNDESAELFDLRKDNKVPAKLWERTKTPLPDFENPDIDTDILHFPSGQDYGLIHEPALPLIQKDARGTRLIHADGSEERFNFLGADCSLPALSPWGDFFVTACPGAKKSDLLLYVKVNGVWQQRPLPGDLNTDNDEIAPRISPDGRYLFFASDGLPGYGGFDYYFSRIDYADVCKAADCHATPRFNPPVNFGPQVNTYHNEFYPLQISPLAKGILFSAQGKKDGLTAKASALTQSIRIAETISYRFIAYHGDQAQPRDVTIKPLSGDARQVLHYGAAAASDRIRLIAGANYEIRFTGPKNIPLHFHIRVPTAAQNSGLNYVTERFSVENSPQAVKMNYAEDAAGVSTAVRPELEDIARRLRANPLLNVLIEGHTDNIGGEAYNRALSEKRAEAVKKQLIGLGISPQRITARGWGQLRPLNTNADADERARNRRVEILVVP